MIDREATEIQHEALDQLNQAAADQVWIVCPLLAVCFSGSWLRAMHCAYTHHVIQVAYVEMTTAEYRKKLQTLGKYNMILSQGEAVGIVKLLPDCVVEAVL